MDPIRAQRIEEILQSILDLPETGRAQFIQGACGNDILLRSEIQQLLNSAAATDEFLRHAPSVLAKITAPGRRLSIGARISHYTIESHLGSGGMGEVYLARDEQLPRRVAIKILTDDFSSDTDHVRRFEQEAHIIADLKHPNILTIHEIGQIATTDEPIHFIVTEFVEGSTLQEYLTQSPSGGRLPWRQAVRIGTQVAAALKAAHDAGIVHRDVKPENVMVQPDGHVKILDFGIAKRVEKPTLASTTPDSFATYTCLGARPGTIRYMSPEQALGEPLDPRTDIFSFGLILYKMLSGILPHGDADGAEILRWLNASVEVQPISVFRPDVPALLDRIIRRALRKNRAERYPSAGDILNDLTGLDAGVSPRPPQAMRTEDANRILTQHVVRHEGDGRIHIPMRALWTVLRYSDLTNGALERQLVRKSVQTAIIRMLVFIAALGVASVCVAAYLSTTDTWDEQVLHDGHSAAARMTAFSPDGRLLVSVGEDQKVIVWDFAHRQRLATFADDHTGWITSVAFSHDASRFATASYDKTVIIWNVKTLTKEATLRGHKQNVYAVAFTPDDEKLISAGGDGLISWRTSNWDRITEIATPGFEVSSLLFPSGNDELFYNRSPFVWDLSTGTHERSLKLNDLVGGNTAALSPDRRTMISVDSNGTVFFTDFPGQQLIRSYDAHHDNGRAAAFSPDGRFAVTGAENIILWDAITRTKITTIDYPSIVWSATFSPDGRWLVTSHADGSIAVWDMVERHRTVGFDQHEDSVRTVAWSADNKTLASGGADGAVMIWNTETGRRETVLLGHGAPITGVAFARDNSFMASVDFSGTIIIWDVPAYRERLRFHHPVNVPFQSNCLAISPDGKWIGTTHGMYDVATGKQVAGLDFKGDQGADIYGIDFSADGDRFAVADAAGRPFIYSWTTRSILSRPDLRPRSFVAIRFSSDGKHLVTGEDSGIVQLWTADSFQPLTVLGKHQARVNAVAFSPDGKYVASTGDDNMLALWDLNKPKSLTRIGTHVAPLLTAAFSPDGLRVAVGGDDHTVRLFQRWHTLWHWRWQ